MFQIPVLHTVRDTGVCVFFKLSIKPLFLPVDAYSSVRVLHIKPVFLPVDIQHTAHPVSVLIHPTEIQALWSQHYRYAVRRRFAYLLFLLSC